MLFLEFKKHVRIHVHHMLVQLAICRLLLILLAEVHMYSLGLE